MCRVNSRAWIWGISVALCAAAIGYGYYLTAQPKQEAEPAAPEIKQPDGSVVLERKPAPKPTKRHVIPKGGKVEREVSVTVQPETAGPVTVDWSLLKLPDNTRRVVASSPDGDVVAGIDIPVAPLPAERKWAAGLSYDPIYQTPGIWVERDYSRIRVGVDINQTRIRVDGPSGIEARIRIGVTF